MTTIRFEVLGVPQPKGSTKAFMPKGARFPVVTEDNANTRPWAATVAAEARIAMARRPPLDVPVDLSVVFYLPRPKSAPKRITRPAKKPDTDKLLRAVMDGLKAGGAYRDDALVVDVQVSKRFAAGSRLPSAAITLKAASEKVPRRHWAEVDAPDHPMLVELERLGREYQHTPDCDGECEFQCHT